MAAAVSWVGLLGPQLQPPLQLAGLLGLLLPFASGSAVAVAAAVVVVGSKFFKTIWEKELRKSGDRRLRLLNFLV